MPTWDCWHRVEYRREVAVGHRTHEYTEIVEDAGLDVSGARSLSSGSSSYTRIAEDFLDRVNARPGTWVVAVWRTGVCEGTDKGELRGPIRMKRTKKIRLHSATKVS